MKVINIIQTCSACPSQWEGHMDDGRMFYARYRWGNLSIKVSKKPTDDIFEAMEVLIYNEQLGDDFDGVLPENKLKKIMKSIGFSFKLQE